MFVRRLTALAGVIALGAFALVMSFGSNSSAVAPVEPVPTTGYTVIDNGSGLCDLYSIDLATGLLTDLPAASSEAACVLDLAVAPNGTVYGITGTRFLGVGSIGTAVDSLGGAELVTFSANGTPSGQSLTVGGLPISGVSAGSIAVNAAGVVYVIAINETTCGAPVGNTSIEPSDTYTFHCLFTVNLGDGSMTQISEGFSRNVAIFGLTSCATNMWMISPGLLPLSVPNEPATLSLPWFSIDPTTGYTLPAGATSGLLGYDCLATGSTVYALSASNIGVTSSFVGTADIEDHMLGTVDPNTGVFTPTVALSDPTVLVASFLDFAVAPPAVTPEPAAPIFTH